MKIKIIKEALVRNKKMIGYLTKKWKLESPDLTEDEVITILGRYDELKEGLSIKKPQVKSFLLRFDGQHKEFFDPKNIKSIEKFSLEQIKSLLIEYTNEPFADVEDVNYTKENSKSTPEKVEVSKQLWYGERFKIFDNNGLRVYQIPNQKVSMMFGFYLEYVTKQLQKSNTSPWCVTWRPGQGSNLWETYRSQGKTFYFIIDDKKNPETDKFHLSAFQILKHTKESVVITSVRNDGDKHYLLNEAFNLYPELENNMDMFKSVDFTKNELAVKNKLALINETENDPNEFRRQERPVKLSYINQGNPLTKSISWTSLDEGLRATYIVLTNPNNFMERFPNLEFISEFKKSNSDVNLLSNRGVTLGMLMDQYVKDKYKVARVSIDNQNIRVYENKSDKKYGIYHASYADFYRLNNINYTPEYIELSSEMYMDDEGNDYMVEIYSKTGTEDPTAFYVVIPIRSDNKKGQGHFLSNSSWVNLKSKLEEKNKEDIETDDNLDDIFKEIPPIDPETDSDIKEKREF